MVLSLALSAAAKSATLSEPSDEALKPPSEKIDGEIRPYSRQHNTLYLLTARMSKQMEKVIKEHTPHVASCRQHRAHTTHLHVAAIVKRGKVLATAENNIGSRSRGAGYSDYTIHAEKAVVKKVGDISQLRGASLCVWRVSAISVLPSKPCADCQIFLEKCMREYGLRAVYYSDTILPIGA